MRSQMKALVGQRRRGALAGFLLMTTMLAGGAVPNMALAQAGNAAAARFDIPAQPLGDALTDFGQQSGLQVSVDAAAIRGLSSPGVSGAVSPAEALSRLLAGSGFTFRIDGDVVTLQPAPQANGAIQLGAVQVEGLSRRSSAVTEGTGSYTAPQVSRGAGLNLSIRDTPQSVTVITSQVMEDKRIEDVFDIVEHTPGLSVNRYESNRGSLFARGFKITNYLVDGVQTSIDEQWSAGEVFTSTAIYDRVEVLRGADGLLIGVGNPSGVINLVRKRADADAFTGSAMLEGGSWSHYGGGLDINTPLTPSGTTRIRVVADYDKRDSYLDRMENRTYILYGTIEQDLGERTVLSVGVSHQDTNTDSPTWGGAPAWTLDSAGQPTRLELPRSFNPAADWAMWSTKHTTAFGRIEHDFGAGWTGRASYTRGERDSESELALFYPRPIDPDTGRSFRLSRGSRVFQSGNAGLYAVENIKEDVNLSANGQLHLLGRTHDLTFGFDHSRERFDTYGSPGVPSETLTPSIFDFDPSVSAPSYIASPNNYKNHVVTQDAFYAAGRFSIADPVSLIAGARHISYSFKNNKPGASVIGADATFDAKDRFLPYAALVVSPLSELSLYASYTTIFQPQSARDVDNNLLPPIEGNTYELGVKGELFDGRLNASLSVYRMEQKNVAQFDQIVFEELRVASKPSDGLLSEGFEAEINGEILPGWNVAAGYSQFRAKMVGPEDPLAGLLGTGPTVSTLIPRRQFKIFTTYDLHGALEGLTIGGGARWQSETYSHPAQAQTAGVPKLSQGAYVVADLMARYRISDAVSVQLNVANLFDKKYFAPTDDGMQVFWQEPRNVRMSMRYHF